MGESPCYKPNNLALAVACCLLSPGCRYSTKNTAPIRIACVGDSTTMAMGESGEDYPAILAKKLGKNYNIANFGASGTAINKLATAPYDRSSAFGQSLSFAPDLVILMLGTNDSKATNWAHKAEFQADFKDMVRRYQNSVARPKVYLVLPCPVFDLGSDIKGPIIDLEIIPAIRQVARESGATILDVHSAVMGHPEYFRDGIHPNSLGTHAIASEIYRGLRR